MSASLALLFAMAAWFCWFDFLSSIADRDNIPTPTISTSGINSSAATRANPCRRFDLMPGELSFWRGNFGEKFTALYLFKGDVTRAEAVLRSVERVLEILDTFEKAGKAAQEIAITASSSTRLNAERLRQAFFFLSVAVCIDWVGTADRVSNALAFHAPRPSKYKNAF